MVLFLFLAVLSFVLSNDPKFLIKKSGNAVYMYKATAGAVCMPPSYDKKWTRDGTDNSQVETCSGTPCTGCTSPSQQPNGDIYTWKFPGEEYQLPVDGGLTYARQNVYFTNHYNAGQGCDLAELIYSVYNRTTGSVISCDTYNETKAYEVYLEDYDSPSGCDGSSEGTKAKEPCFPDYYCQEVITEADDACGVNKVFCFSENSKLEKPDGSKIRLKNAQVGELVMSIDSSSGEVVETKIVDIVIHRNSGRSLKKVTYTFKFEDEDIEGELYITDNHYLYFASEKTDDISTISKNMKFASELSTGDIIVARFKGSVFLAEVKKIEIIDEDMVMGTVYTENGKVFVDGVLASSYSVSGSNVMVRRFELFAQQLWFTIFSLIMKFTGFRFQFIKDFMTLFVENIWHVYV